MNKLLLIFMLVGAYALNFSYDGEIFVEPGVERTANIYVQSINESGTYFVSCSSNLSMSCPNYVQILAGRETEVPVVFLAKRGFYPVNVTIGEKLIRFVVKSSNQTQLFYDRLAQQNETFNRLESRYGPHHLIEIGRGLLSEGFLLYDEGEYASVEGVSENLDTILSEYYGTIEIPGEEEPARLSVPVLSIFVLGGLFAFYFYRTRKPQQRPGTGELSKLMEKERGGVQIGNKKENN